MFPMKRRIPLPTPPARATDPATDLGLRMTGAASILILIPYAIALLP